MRFLVDAQLPRRLSNWLCEQGHDALHTLDLPEGNRTKDQEVVRIADTDDRIVITKDDDFVRSHLLRGETKRLLLITSGNVSNNELLQIFRNALPALRDGLLTAHFLELNSDSLILH